MFDLSRRAVTETSYASDCVQNSALRSASSNLSLSPLALAVRTTMVGASLCLATGVSQAASIIVTSNTDNSGTCRLRDAIRSVNLGAVSNSCVNTSSEAFGINDTITFANPGIIVLGGEGELLIEKSVVINASTVSGVTIDANQNSRVMKTANQTSVTLTNLTLTGGNASDGGAIYGGEGVEITMVDSTVTGNESSGFGGGLFVYGYGSSVNIVNSEFSNNVADSDGGAIYLEQDGGNTLTLTNSRIVNNVATRDEGGGIWSAGYDDVISLTDSVVMNNTAGTQGGGIYLEDGTLTLTNTSISGNSSTESGGGVYGSSSSTITVLNSTISGNSAAEQGGGIFADSDYLTLTNSTVSGNTADQQGGGIYTGANTTLSHSTVANNTNGIAYIGAGVYSSGELTLTNSILADSIGGEDCAAFGSVIADAQSIVEDGNCGSFRSGDPGLLPLANNGGRTLTHALADDSIAINTGNNATCVARDQRGFTRNDRACDVGAFEVQDDGGFFVIPLKNGKVVVIPE